jgi:hypothetical protein
MSTGGIFTIVTNDGKQDRMLMATALLHERLDRIWKFKRSQNPNAKDDDNAVLPTLLDIEKTHILFTNAHFKPFAAIGFEYNKVRPTSGSVSLNSTIQFSIPQFGDFFHDIAFHCVLWQPTINVTPGTAASDQPAMRWAAWPGERLLRKVQQEVNGNPLDEYTSHATVAHREYRVAPNKLTAWKRCVGQEETEVGQFRQRDWANSGAAPDNFRMDANVRRGAQTATGQKPVDRSGCLELFVPLLFWYNKDVRLAVPSVAIPYGQRFINIELASATELVGLVPRGSGTWATPNGTLTDPAITDVELYINNIFVNPEVHKIYIKRVGFSLIRVHRQQTFSMTGLKSEENLHLQQLKWPIEYLFIGAKVKDYFNASSDTAKRQYLDVWDRYSVATTNSYSVPGQSVLRETKLAVSDAGQTLGVDAGGNLTGSAVLAQALSVGDTIRVGSSLLTVTANVAAAAAVTGVTTSTNGLTLVNSNALAASAVKVSYEGLEVQTKSFTPTLDSIMVQAHGVDLYKDFPAAFFNSYTTYHYGGPNINAPQDVGSLFVPFCLYPGTYQPSGHINVSRAREIYLKSTSQYFGNNNVSGLMVVIASAINFLLISDGSAVLRYST